MSSTTEGAASAPPKRKRKPRSKPAKRYPSDLTDAQWPLIEPLLPPPATSGRAEEHPRREIVNVRGSKLARGRMFPGRGPSRSTKCWLRTRRMRTGAGYAGG